MHIILLSGGSGKRLWPLSNEVRSKQFLRLFQNDKNEYESMLQRVYRQIMSVNENAQITIAAGKSQVSAIRNQLGQNILVCVEPSRRDTFPAIMLAAAYLKYEQEMSDDTCVAVCPVDPFVEESYYKAVNQLEQYVKQDAARLTLMGIEPTYPSEKYGYIIPKTADDMSAVEAFREKPDADTARQYIGQGALWNAGIFACKLGYLLEKAHSVLDFTDCRDLYAKYDSLPKTSFDYAVVEQEADIQVMRYAGAWRDVGTWNMMAEVMPDLIKGNVTLDETCRNTHVVNELDIPVLCMGCEDMIIAASGDGILVSDKERSGYMKPFVEKINTDIRFAEKSWGTYTVIDAQPTAMTAKIVIKQGHSLKYHSHAYRNETWNIISGTGHTVVDGMEQQVTAGDVVSVAAGCKHTIMADTELHIIEVQVGSEIDKQDKTIYWLEQ